MFRLSKDLIYHISTPLKFKKGMDYFKDKRVKAVSFNEDSLFFDASVLGTRPYNVQVFFNKNGICENYCCSCSEGEEITGCKHIVAVLLFINERDELGFFDAATQRQMAKQVFDFYLNKTGNIKNRLNTEYTIEFLKSAFRRSGPSAVLTMKIGTDRLYVVKSFEELFEAMKTNREIAFGKGFSFDPARFQFEGADSELLDYLREIWENDNLVDYFSVDIKKKSFFKGKEIYLSEPSLIRILSIIGKTGFNAVVYDKNIEIEKVIDSDIPIEFTLAKNGGGIELTADSLQPIKQLTADGRYYLFGSDIYKITEEQRDSFAPFFRLMEDRSTCKVSFVDQDKERFFTDILPYIEKASEIYIDEELQDTIERLEFEPEIYLDRIEDIITGEVRFKYGERIINPFSANGDKPAADKILIRDSEREGIILDILAETDCRVSSDKIYLDEEEKIFDFVNSVIPKLQQFAQIFYSDSFKAMSFKKIPSFSGYLRLNTLGDFLEFNFSIDGVDRSELSSIFNSIKQKKKYYRLKDGTFLPLDMVSLQKIGELAEQLELDTQDFENEMIKLPKYRALYLDNLLKDSGIKFFERNSALKDLIRDISLPEETEYKIPEGVKGTLRDYQKLGFKWMKTLAAYGLGGILADDMGLGKTLQVISLLKYDREHLGQAPSIVVVPTSLVYNWCSEVQKFAPDLSITAVVGSKPERQQLIKTGLDGDILVTSYALIRRDIEEYKQQKFRYCILDEAQHIKNPASQAAKAVKQISAQHRLGLTGTPMENNLTELWSVFDFILPGYLGSHGKFVENYESPIAKGDNDKLSALSRHIKPFVLRRLKQDVLRELPEKIEHVIEAELTEDQKKLYIAYLEQAKGEIMNEIVQSGFAKSQIKILSVLTRLRQLCCHPSLFIEDYTGESGKLQLLKEIVQDSIEAGHRLLIFSQFTSMLAIIRKWFEQEEIDYLYLDGSTPADERMRLVRRFNNGDGKVFLLSLKSGGTGLNLTGADTVIHYDPWWNPAVEDQATDRAYRIGQTKNVHVMKLVTHGTIEEKILSLKERKRQLVDAVIQTGETLITKLTQQDLEELFR